MTSMRHYADLQLEIMRQYADRVVTHTRHPAVFAACFQGYGIILLANGWN